MISMLNYWTIIPTIVISAVAFHILWMIPTFLRMKNSVFTKNVFEMVHAGAKWGTLSGFVLSIFWVAAYSFTASFIFIFTYNYFFGP